VVDSEERGLATAATAPLARATRGTNRSSIHQAPSAIEPPCRIIAGGDKNNVSARLVADCAVNALFPIPLFRRFQAKKYSFLERNEKNGRV
jgi:hypothetical protein